MGAVSWAFSDKGDKMIPCPYCGRHFKNKQALRAHLKHCPLKNKKTEKGNSNDFERLLLKYMLFLSNLDYIPERFTVSEIANALNCSKETVRRFISWLRSSEYYEVVKLVITAKRLTVATP